MPCVCVCALIVNEFDYVIGMKAADTERVHTHTHTHTHTLTHKDTCFRLAVVAVVLMCRIGQNHIYTVYMRYFWQGNHRIYGHIRCMYTVLANPTGVLVAQMLSA